MNDVRFYNFGSYMYVHVFNHTILQWLEKDFLGYLAEWDEMVQCRENFTAAEKNMTLSKDTLDGLRMTGVEIPSFKFRNVP